MVLPPYKGSVFRGAVGNSIRRLTCANPGGECPNCLLQGQCCYAILFEPAPPLQYPDAKKFTRAPAPYVISPPPTNRQIFHPGDSFMFEIILMGRALEMLPYVVSAISSLGRRGLGVERGKYDLLHVDRLGMEATTIRVYDGMTETFTPCSSQGSPEFVQEEIFLDHLAIEFHTPLRIKEKGKLVTALTFALLFQRLVHRLTLLTTFYGNPESLPDFSSLLAQARKVRVLEDCLYWYDWERYSGRQQSTMKLGGLRGRIQFKGDLGPFVPALRLGESINVGQGTSFGLGKMQVQLT